MPRGTVWNEEEDVVLCKAYLKASKDSRAEQKSYFVRVYEEFKQVLPNTTRSMPAVEQRWKKIRSKTQKFSDCVEKAKTFGTYDSEDDLHHVALLLYNGDVHTPDQARAALNDELTVRGQFECLAAYRTLKDTKLLQRRARKTSEMEPSDAKFVRPQSSTAPAKGQAIVPPKATRQLRITSAEPADHGPQISPAMRLPSIPPEAGPSQSQPAIKDESNTEMILKKAIGSSSLDRRREPDPSKESSSESDRLAAKRLKIDSMKIRLEAVKLMSQLRPVITFNTAREEEIHNAATNALMKLLGELDEDDDGGVGAEK
mmetsp:Transcript_43102/g.168707  ORF Transcript_43102/g.168707 Transcript_43102/m.168707 type:complete len:315 (+) Transcript_43102:881-1825(+)